AILHATFGHDGRRLATASNDKTARVWDTETGHAISPPLRHDDEVNGVTFSPDGRLLATGSDDKSVRFWFPETGQLVGEPIVHDGRVKSVAFSPDGRRLLSTSEGFNVLTACVWDTKSRRLVSRSPSHGGGNGSLGAAFSPDGRRI